MNSVYGSEWRKWDFHVHTPYSVLNNQFGIDASDDSDSLIDTCRSSFQRQLKKIYGQLVLLTTSLLMVINAFEMII